MAAGNLAALRLVVSLTDPLALEHKCQDQWTGGSSHGHIGLPSTG